ncbi:tetratricopeptide repeat protein [Govanella unica]|uniref:Tetratricopeptide repeat protein n=1 Tax=Govanella unica TaxID=2975056 RepID=A0A9X3TXB8_9PROT|nr:tetratricopeptide repeat protein [Govania unica]MDA5193388.1 tetratricopeptide repeat protein [Govania unica]
MTSRIPAARAVALVVATMLGATSACATSTQKPVPAVAQDNPQKQAEDSIAFGSYLAGQAARAQGDTDAAVRYFLDAIAADPDNLLLLQQGFALAISDGRYDEARTLGQRIVKTDADNSLVQFFLLLGDLKAGRYDRVLKELDKVPEAGLNKLVKPIVSAWTYAGVKKKDKALASLKPLEDTPPFLPFALNHRAFILDYLKDPEAEIAYKSGMAAEKFGSVRFVLAYASLLARAGRDYEAKDIITKGSERFEDSLSIAIAEQRLKAGTLKERVITTPAEGVAEAFYGAALALSQDGANGPGAFYLRLALYLQPDFDQATFMLARILEDEQENDSAFKLYQTIQDSSDLGTEARLREVWILEAKGDEAGALSRLEALVAAAPERADLVASLADLYRQRKDYPRAVAEYSRAIALTDPAEASRHWALYYARGMTYDQAKQWPQAEVDFRKALELQPNQADVLNYLGYSLVDRGERLNEAIDMITRAVAQRPNDGYIVDSLGWAEFTIGNYTQAADILERAVLMKPEDPTINEHLGDAYWQVGRKIEARFQWSHALTLNAPEDRVQAIKDKISNGMPKQPVKPSRKI